MKVLAIIKSDMCTHGDWLVGETAKVFEKYSYTHVICDDMTMTGTFIKDTNNMDVAAFDYPMILLGEST